MLEKIHPFKIQIFIAVSAALLFIPFLGGVHLFDWDEINFAEAAREMIVTGNYMKVQIDFVPFSEKPPLFIWMQVISMKIFGINEFAARFPNAICGIVTLLTLFNIGKKLKDNLFGILWVMAFAGSILPFFYFKSGIIDPWFNYFIFLGIYYLVLLLSNEQDKKLTNSILAGFFAGLAVLTKGPVGFLLIALTILCLLIFAKSRLKVKGKFVIIYFAIFFLVGGSWFIIQILNSHTDWVIEFMKYQVRLFETEDVGHGGFWGYHFVVLFFTVFPTSILALNSFKKGNSESDLYVLFKKSLIILLCAVLIVFSIVNTKIIHYSSLSYYPLSFLAANFVFNVHKRKQKWCTWLSVVLIGVATFLAFIFVSLPIIDYYKNEIIAANIIHDNFTTGNLQADVNWSWLETIPALFFLMAVVMIVIFIKKDKIVKRAMLLWSTTAIFTSITAIMIVPRIEKYTQSALIEFIESHKNEDVYMRATYFRSYATYFYGKTTPHENKNYYDLNWLLEGDIDKDVYFITKISRSAGLNQRENLEKIEEKNGYVFFLRRAQ